VGFLVGFIVFLKWDFFEKSQVVFLHQPCSEPRKFFGIKKHYL